MMLVDPYRLAPAVTPLAVLDAYTSGMWACCWMRRLLTSWTSPVLRVRRSSDNAEQDIGYAADNSLDSAALLAFAGAGDAFVTKLYDQTGGGHDAVQSTTGKQPRIVLAGVFDGTLVFDGADDCLTTGNSGTPSIFSVVSRATLRSLSSVCVLLEHGNTGPTAAHSNAVFYNTTGSQGTNLLISTGTNYRLNAQDATTINGVMGAVFDYAQTTGAKSKLYKNGSFIPATNSGLSGSEPSGTFTADPWNFAARNNGASLVSPLNASGFVVWEGVSQAPNEAAISTILSAGSA